MTTRAGLQGILLDFDGPVCAVFGGVDAGEVARELDVLAGGRVRDVGTDPLAVLRAVAGDSRLAVEVDGRLRLREVEAVTVAPATPGAAEALDRWRENGVRVAVVSNNGAEAIEAYLRRTGLCVDAVVGRDADPVLLKPHPHLVVTGLRALGLPARAAVLVGDSVTDVQAARAAGVMCIGYANKPGKRARLEAAGAAIVIDHMAQLGGLGAPA